MPIHLKGQYRSNTGQIDANQLPVDLIDVGQKGSMLEAYFKLNQKDDFARTLLYIEIPEHYNWDGNKSKWNKSVNKVKKIGRMYSVSPSRTELFHLQYFFNFNLNFIFLGCYWDTFEAPGLSKSLWLMGAMLRNAWNLG